LKPPASSRSASAAHARLHHRFHVEWVTKYREKVLQGPMRERIGEII
jgi:putative transposase